MPSARETARGNVVAVIYNHKLQYAVFGDTGPTNLIGEASYATAKKLGIDPDPASAEALRDWAVGYWESLHPYSAGGAYVNFMMDEGQERVQATYRGNYERLAQVKKRYDPKNFFHYAQSVSPAKGQKWPKVAKGDVVVVLQVEPDRFFRREGLDIVCTVPVNLAQALLGSKIKVKTLDGRRVVLKIPPGTQPGQKFRIAGQGIEKNGRRGDQYVEVHVDIPEHLTPEQEVALKAFAERSGMRY